MAIHKTLSDGDGTTYQIVSQLWIRAMTIAMLSGTLVLAMLGIVIYHLMGQLEEAQKFDEISRQRNLATDEMLERRAVNQQFSFQYACLYAKSIGERCLENPQWWADPRKYPLLTGPDSTGSGIFPKEER